ncbi:MAG: hypothetical protein Q8N51_17435 [Gammaproteobacteria bacterium]|nr:hypothetical protein [Gammaproteobacteria bacterium]
MLNAPAKYLLVATSLAPVLGAMAVNRLPTGDWIEWLPWLAPAVALVVVCWGVLTFSGRHDQHVDLKVTEVVRNDKEVLAFLIAYLLPVVSVRDTPFQGQWMTAVYVFVILVLAYAHAGVVHVNPVMGLLGFHFYEVKDHRGCSVLLISRSEVHVTGDTLSVTYLAPTICLRVEKKKGDS